MKKLLILLSLVSIGQVNAQPPTFHWAKSMGGSSDDNGSSMALDAKGNIFTTGWFKGTADFDPNSGVANLSAPGGNYDIFISKLDASGNFIWAKQIGGGSDDEGYSIVIDKSGNVYTTGYFQGTFCDFDPGPTTFYLNTSGLNDIFISKLDSSGNFIWAKSIGGVVADVGSSITVDTTGNVYVTGWFNGIVDFDPSGGTFNLNSAGGDDIFILKLNPSGNFVWAKNMGGTSADWGYSLAVDKNSNIYTTGLFNGPADFDPNSGVFNLNSFGGLDIFISKLDSTGNFIWAKNMGGTSIDGGYSIALVNGNVYTTGYFSGIADFDPSGSTVNLTSAGGVDIFVSKLDTNGNFIWAKNMGSSANDGGFSIVIDSLGSSYTTGFFSLTADFDPGIGTTNLTSLGNEDIFISKLDPSGNFVWAIGIGGALSDVGAAIQLNKFGNLYATGSFNGTADFDPSVNVFNLSSSGGRDIYIFKADSCNFASASYTLTQISAYNWNAIPSYSSNVVNAKWNWGDGTYTIGLYPSHTYTSAGWYNICVTAYSACGDSTSFCQNDSIYRQSSNGSLIYINVINTVNINQLSFNNNQLIIYPNPTSDQFFIQANTTDKLTVDLYDVNGRHVFSKSVNDKSNINVTSLNEGVYTVTIKTVDRVTNKKLVILR